jgi:hypothetical protein
VEVETGGAVIRKTFAGDDPERSWRQAEVERDRLQRFADALTDVPGVVCPRPIELLAGPPAVLRMPRLPGRPILELLRAAGLRPSERDRIADAAATGLARYVDALGEPYEDFQFDNMLFDSASATLAFVDLGAPDDGTDGRASGPPLEVSLGNLLGSTVFQSARPKWLVHRRQHRQAADLCGAVVRRLAGAGAGLSVEDIVPFARDAYARSAFGGGWSRRIWYGSIGYLVARRPEIAGVRFTPPRRQPRGSAPRSVPGRTNKK